MSRGIAALINRVIGTSNKPDVKPVANPSQNKHGDVSRVFDIGSGAAIKTDLVEGLRMVCAREVSIEEIYRWTEPYLYNGELEDQISSEMYDHYSLIAIQGGVFKLMTFKVDGQMPESEMKQIFDNRNTDFVQQQPITFIIAFASSMDTKTTSNYVVTFEQVLGSKVDEVIRKARKKPKGFYSEDVKVRRWFPDYFLLGGVLFRSKIESSFRLDDFIRYILFDHYKAHFCLINDHLAVEGLNALIKRENVKIDVIETPEGRFAEINIRVEADPEFSLYPTEAKIARDICAQLGIKVPRIKEEREGYVINSEEDD